SKKDKVRLMLSAAPRQGFEPMRVSFNVVLQGVASDDEDWYCQKEEWDFGDGAVSSEQPNCDEFSANTPVTTEFFADHLYDNAGQYTIRFTLGNNRLRSNQLSVLVLENQLHN